jgi:hypothetical protein
MAVRSAVGYKRLVTQETPQSTRSRSWPMIVGLVLLAIVGAFIIAQLACPKPNPGKPVPADTAPPPGLADGPQKQDDGKSGVTG